MKSILVIAIAVVLLVPINVFAQSQIGLVYVEKDIYEISYSEKTVVHITGHVNSLKGSEMVTLSIIDPHNESHGAKIVPSSNGNFEFSMEFDSDSLKGTYKVMASYKGKIFEKTSFVIKEKKLTIEDILKARGERIEESENTPIPEPPKVEPIPKDLPPTTSQRPVPNFVDPQKDPQYYLDRYYNEPKYKEWFDRNFPDYTIEKAVGIEPKTLVPAWVKNISLWFGEGKIAEREFLDAVSFLIKNNILNSNQQTSVQDRGNFQVVYDSTSNSNYVKIQNKLKQTQFFEKKSNELNSKLKLPNNITVNITECDEINAFYDRNSNTIIICYEMYEYLTDLFSSMYDDEQTINGSIDGAMEFFFLHELGHALIDVYNIPITGMEEDAVDQLATIILLQKGNDGISAIAATAGFFGIHGMSVSNVNDLAFYDEHSLDLQRFYNILCFAYGSDVNEFGVLIDLNLLPKERAIQCPDEYSKISKSWNTLLAPYEKSASLVQG